MMTFSEAEHLPIETLADYAECRLTPDDAARAAAHLAGCPACQADVAWLRQIIVLIGSDDWEDAPSALTRQIVRSFRPAPSPFALWAAWLRRPPIRLAAAFVVLLLLLSGYWLLRPPARKLATITAQQGLVEIRRENETAWRTATGTVVLSAGSEIRTGPDSGARLPFFDGSILHLGANTTINVDAIVAGDDGGRIVLLRQSLGSVRYEVETAPTAQSRFEINTPGAAIFVHGTVFDLQVAPDGATTLHMVTGQVTVRAQNEEMVAAANQTVLVAPGQPPLRLSPIPPTPTRAAIRLATATALPVVTASATPTDAPSATPTQIPPTRTPSPAPSDTATSPPPTTQAPPSPPPPPTETQPPPPSPTDTQSPPSTATRGPVPVLTVTLSPPTLQPTSPPEGTRVPAASETPFPIPTPRPTPTLSPTHAPPPTEEVGMSVAASGSFASMFIVFASDGDGSSPLPLTISLIGGVGAPGPRPPR